MRRWLRSTALALLFSSVLPFAAPDLFIYKSAHAEVSPQIPDWGATSCCGPQDAHKLRADQVYRNDNGTWHADGYPSEVPNEVAMPSQDGNAWAFYADHTLNGGAVSMMYCLFFVPSI